MLTELTWPRGHLVMDDFFSPAALAAVFRELPSLDRLMKPGLVRDLGHDGQSVFFAHERRQNRAVWIHDPSRILHLFREHLWSADNVAQLAHAREPLFQIIPECSAPHLQVSSYLTGDHYDFHEDEGAGVNLTAIVFLARDPKKVRGGDLVLSYDGEETTIPFQNNRLLVFPSKTLHRVTPVRVASDDPRDARISLQCWLTHGRQETKPKPRAPAADQPTFLLAEEPIIAAAQALAGGDDQAPEDLYWGAFYLSRILSANLRALAAGEEDLTLGKVHIRRAGGVEVHARGQLAGAPVRVGFTIEGRPTAAADALSLFVETGRGTAKSVLRRRVPFGAEERQVATLLRHLLTSARGGRTRTETARRRASRSSRRP